MFAQRHLNLPINQRTVLVTVDMVRASLGVDADSVAARVEAGELRWVFDVAAKGSQIRELRFWAKAIIAPERVADLTLSEAVGEILGDNRKTWRGTEVEHLLLISRPTVKKLHDDGELPGDLVGRTFIFGRAALESFFKRRAVK